jgi:hypothetical protein
MILPSLRDSDDEVGKSDFLPLSEPYWGQSGRPPHWPLDHLLLFENRHERIDQPLHSTEYVIFSYGTAAERFLRLPASG